MIEAGFLFFVAAIIIGAINWKDAGHFISTLYAGCKDFIGVVFILTVGKGLAITLTDSGLNRVVADGLGGVLSKIPAVMSILLVFIVIALLTTIIPSSSGLSSAMFPVIGPAICSVPAISVSGSVTSFAAAMGWMNLITPAGMLLPFLEVSKMDLGQFYKSA
ncbi:MAG: hypothetical protein MJ223_00480 [Mycoplasmoidaceae bacterium]|nr:hypothetical protein [Mycoplasmoidaceae bacterium]